MLCPPNGEADSDFMTLDVALIGAGTSDRANWGGDEGVVRDKRDGEGDRRGLRVQLVDHGGGGVYMAHFAKDALFCRSGDVLFFSLFTSLVLPLFSVVGSVCLVIALGVVVLFFRQSQMTSSPLLLLPLLPRHLFVAFSSAPPPSTLNLTSPHPATHAHNKQRPS